jgi:hypothetical protein
MLLMSMLALARRSPRVYIESLSSGHPPLAHFFGAAGNELETLTFALFTICFESSLVKLSLVILVKVATEATGKVAHAETVFFGTVTNPSDVHSSFNSLLGMFKFPRQHFFGPWSWSNRL